MSEERDEIVGRPLNHVAISPVLRSAGDDYRFSAAYFFVEENYDLKNAGGIVLRNSIETLSCGLKYELIKIISNEESVGLLVTELGNICNIHKHPFPTHYFPILEGSDLNSKEWGGLRKFLKLRQKIYFDKNCQNRNDYVLVGDRLEDLENLLLLKIKTIRENEIKMRSGLGQRIILLGQGGRK